MSRAQVVIVVAGIALAVFILELVRRRRLREEYSWLWILVAIGYFLLAIWPGLAERVATLLGSTSAVSAFTFLGFLFLFLICVQFSVQISRLTEQNKNLTQQIAVLDGEVRRLEQEGDGQESADPQEWQIDAECVDDRSRRLVPRTDQHQPARESLAGVGGPSR
jgi:hypothetical protein